MNCEVLPLMQGLASGTDQPDFGRVGSEGTGMPVPSHIKLGKNYSIFSAEDIPLVQHEDQATQTHYP